MTPETCNSPDSIRSETRTEEAQAVNVTLAPCPFCGWDTPALQSNKGNGTYWVTCDCCGAQSGGFQDSSLSDQTLRDYAAKDWNRRAAPALPQDVAALVAKLRAYPRDRNGNFDILSYRLTGQDAASLILSQQSTVAAQSSTIASAREVIEPFASVAEFDIGDSESDTDIFKPVDGRHSVAGLLRVGHLRAARAWKGSAQ